MVECLPDLGHAAFEQAKVEQHPGRGIGRAAHDDLGPERVAVDLLAGRAIGRSRQGVRRLESERFRQFPHRQSCIAFQTSYLMPSVLWVCTLSRHCGWRRQYSTARAVFSITSGPSIGCSEKRWKARAAKVSGTASACG